MELTRNAEVGEGGRIDIVVPELEPGQRVELHIVTVPSVRKRRKLGHLKGLIHMSDDFDAPLSVV